MDLRSVIQSFGTLVNVETPQVTTWSGGIASEPGKVTRRVLMVIQPISGRDAQILPDGVRVDDVISVWAVSRLRTVEDPDGKPADRIVWQGARYEVQSCEDWNHLGTYYKVVARRLR